MTLLSIPLLVALPALGALVLSGLRQPSRARDVATGTAALTLAVSAVTWFLVDGPAPGHGLQAPGTLVHWLGLTRPLGVDGPGLLALPLTALLILGVVLFGPRQSLSRSVLVALLLTESMTLGFFCTRDLTLMLAFFVAMMAPMGALLAHGEQGARAWRVFRAYLFVGTLPLLIAAVGMFLLTRHTGTRPPPLLSSALRPGICVLLLMGVGARMAVVPFQSWLPVLLSRGPLGVGVLFILNLAASLHLLTHVVMPLMPGAWWVVGPWLGSLGACTALYGALLALTQVDLRRMVGFLLVSQSGLLLAGVAMGGEEGLTGAWLQCLMMGVAFTGLELLVRALEARTGTPDMTRLGGLAVRGTRMATLFLLLGLASLGFPGTLGFVSEDLLLRGTLGAHPVLALPLLPALALNAITLLRAFQRAFLGPGPQARGATPGTFQDLLPRERWTALSLVAVLLLGGLLPSAPHKPSVKSLATGEVAPGAPASPPRAGPPGLSVVAPGHAYREPEVTRNEREHHVPDGRTKGPGGRLRGHPARVERL